MKRNITSSVFCLSSFICIILVGIIFPSVVIAQDLLVIDDSQDPVTLLSNTITGEGVDISNISVTGDQEQFAYFSKSGSGSFGSNPLVLDEGIIMCTGQAINVGLGDAANTSDNRSDATSTNASDPDLVNLSGNSIFDAAVIEFDLVTTGNILEFQYVFASDEFPEYVCSQFNDAFGIFISGGSQYSSPTNIATIPDTDVPIAVNTLNSGVSGQYADGTACNTNHSDFYIDNHVGNGSYVEYDGLSTLLSARADVTPGVSYHFKVAIGDAGDNAWDSGLFLNIPALVSYIAEVCDNGIDDDGDGLIDLDDPDCTPNFTNEGSSPVTEPDTNSWGVTSVDFNGDCAEDILLLSYEEDQPNILYINNGEGEFSKMEGGPLESKLASSTGASWADIDNDGDPDLAVSNNVGSPNFLFENKNFRLLEADGGDLDLNDGYAHNLSFTDYDKDGFVDLFVTDYFETKFNQLYHNNGDGTFEQVTSGILVNDALPAIGATWADVNGDGWQDVYVPVYGGADVLYINKKNGDFDRKVMPDSGNSTGSSFADFDNDGDQDLFVPVASGQQNVLYTNDGTGNFTKVENSTISLSGADSHGSAWGDFNNDGWLDLVVGNDQNEANELFLNKGDGTFAKSNDSFGSLLGNSFGLATADFNDDGALDIAVANHSGESNYLLTNSESDFNFVKLFLVGTNSNVSGIGSIVSVTATLGGEQITQTHEIVGQSGGGSSSQSSFIQHFGLGEATVIDEIRIQWPSGYIQTLTNVNVNQKLRIVEENGSVVSGVVFHDENGNCVQDSGELPIPNTVVEINPGPFYAMSDENGFYEIYLEPNNYVVNQQSNSYLSNACQPSGYSVTVEGIGYEYPNKDFPLTASSVAPDLAVELGLTALRKGFENDMMINYSNFGVAEATNVQLTLTLDPDVTLNSSTIPWDSFDGTTATWNLGSLGVNEIGSISLANYVELSAELDNDKAFTVVIACDEEEWTLVNNMQCQIEKVVGAVDPNDILVSPRGYGPAGLIKADQELTYRIRFQNVGNFPAKKVVVIDTLSSNVDMNTFKMSSISHEAELEFLSANILKWTFNNIDLPDSTNFERASHGFIQYKVSPKEGLLDGDFIFNSASIRFDFNPYIKTNEVVNTVDFDYESIDMSKPEVTVYPNPASDQVNIFFTDKVELDKDGEIIIDNELKGQREFRMFDSQGRLVKQFNVDGNIEKYQFSVQEYLSGFYILVFKDDQGNRKNVKLVIR